MNDSPQMPEEVTIYDKFPYYKLVATLATGQRLAKLFDDRVEASQAFTLVAHCRCLEPFGRWHSDRLFLRSLRQRFPEANTPEAIRDLVPRNYDVAPLGIENDLALDSDDDAYFDPPTALVLTHCHGQDHRELERLSAEQLRDLAARWDERVEHLEPVPASVLI